MYDRCADLYKLCALNLLQAYYFNYEYRYYRPKEPEINPIFNTLPRTTALDWRDVYYSHLKLFNE